MKRAMAVVAILAVAGIGAQERKFKKNYAQDGVYWAASWEDALKEAKERNVGIHLAVHKDNWPGCQSMESSTYPDKKYIESSRMWVNVACHTEKTHAVDAVVNGKRVTVCSAYWNIPCEAHAKCYSASGNYPGITGLPTTVYTDPEGKELQRVVGGKGSSELIKIQKELLEKIPGEKISVDEWNAAKSLLEQGDSEFAKGEWKKAVEAFTRVSKMPRKVLKEKGAEGLNKLEEKGREFIAQAKEKVETEKEEAKKILKMVINDFKPLACSKEATAALKEIPADEKK